MEEKENASNSLPENNAGEAKLYSEKELKELIDDFVMKLRMARHLRTPEYNELFGGDPMWITESVGGITVSGGEPLLQADFVYELFSLCRAEKIHTVLDTSGCIMNDSAKKLLSVTDMCLLDYKMTNDEDYRKYAGCGIG